MIFRSGRSASGWRLTRRFSLAGWVAASALLLDAEPNAVPVAAADAVHQLPDYVVQARHFEASVLDIPTDVLRIGRETIEQSLASSLPELLEAEANLLVSGVSGFETVDLRGFGEGSGLRNLILVDGQPLNPPDMGRIDWERIPLGAVESIEVLRGGHNVLYGDQALAGVIKIETRRSGEHSLTAEGRLGSFESSRFSLAGSSGGDAWSVRGGGARSESEGYRTHSASWSRNGFLNLARSFRNGDDLDLRLAVGEIDLTYPGGLVYEDYRSDPKASDKLGIEGSQNEYVTLTSRAQGRRSWGAWEVLAGFREDRTDFVFEPVDFYGRTRQSGVSVKPRARIGDGAHQCIVGLDAAYDDARFTAFLDASRHLDFSHADLEEVRLSPYLLFETEFADGWTLSAGARYEHVRYSVDAVTFVRNQINPIRETSRGPRPNPDFKRPPDVVDAGTFAETIREGGTAAELSLNWRAGERLSAFIGYDRVYRYPVFDERAAYQGLALAEAVSPVEAEAGDSFELGFKYLDAHQEFFVTGFALRMDNEIFFDPTVTGSIPGVSGLNVNLGEVRRHGFDLYYGLDFETWGGSIQLSHVDAKMRTGIGPDETGKGRQLPLLAPWVTTSRIWWEPLAGLRLWAIHRSVAKRYDGEDFANEARPIAAYQRVDLGGSLKVAPQARIFFRMTNALDTLYAESAVSGAFYPGDGRAVELGAELHF